jgi:transposase
MTAPPPALDPSDHTVTARTGRTPLLTAELTKRLCKMLQQGSFRNRAAVACGIGESTFYRWLELSTERTVNGKTRRARPEYVEFREAIEEAEAVAEQFLVTTIRTAAYAVKQGEDGVVVQVKDWRAAAYLLERKFRERWAPEPDVVIDQRTVTATVTPRAVVFGGRYRPDGVLTLPPASPAAVIEVQASAPETDHAGPERTQPQPGDDAVSPGVGHPRPALPDV